MRDQNRRFCHNAPCPVLLPKHAAVPKNESAVGFSGQFENIIRLVVKIKVLVQATSQTMHKIQMTHLQLLGVQILPLRDILK